MTDEERKAHGQRSIDGWSEASRTNMKSTRLKQWADMSPERRAAHAQAIRDGHARQLEETKMNIGAVRKQQWADMSPERKAAHAQAIRDGLAKRKQSKT